MIHTPVVPKCPSGKRRYLFASDAFAAVKRARDRHAARQHPYLCPHCHNWHLTTYRP